MADTHERTQRHELRPQDQDPWWRVADTQTRQSVALWLADHTGLPAVTLPPNDLFQPPSPLAEFPPAGASEVEAQQGRPAKDSTLHHEYE